MLRDGLVQSEQKKHQYLDTLNKEAKRLSHLVENVLAYSQIERGKVTLTDCALSELLPPIIDRLQSRIAQTQAHLTVSNECPPSTVLRTDPTAVEQILFNLLDNACKYALDEHPSQEISLSINLQQKYITFTLQDQGPGIHRRDLSRLFEPFHKSSETAAHTRKPGVGLGLSIAKKQAQILKGSLTLLPSKSQGARFRLQLPM